MCVCVCVCVCACACVRVFGVQEEFRADQGVRLLDLMERVFARRLSSPEESWVLYLSKPNHHQPQLLMNVASNHGTSTHITHIQPTIHIHITPLQHAIHIHMHNRFVYYIMLACFRCDRY